ncbi:MAG: GNAT family N-acetyltransferase [Caldisericia bacterium]|nr:GNAT family N-acetyltransferase [Caldisericia bacterium]
MNTETDRLRIINFDGDDWQALQKTIIDKEKSKYAHMDHTWPTDSEKIKEICNWFSQGDEFLAVRTKDEDLLIGFICLNNTDSPKVKNLGYCLHSSHQGKGFALEACTALLKKAFENEEIEKIITGTGLANSPSVGLLEKLGFVLISKSKVHFRSDSDGNPMFFEGGLFELTKERWQNHAKL